MNELVAVLVAIAGAVTFGASDVIEQRATHRVAKRPPLDVKLFADLAVNRLWLIGITVDIAASAMQAIALHFGPLALVQPILVLDLLFAVVITSALTLQASVSVLPLCGSASGSRSSRCASSAAPTGDALPPLPRRG